MSDAPPRKDSMKNQQPKQEQEEMEEQKEEEFDLVAPEISERHLLEQLSKLSEFKLDDFAVELGDVNKNSNNKQPPPLSWQAGTTTLRDEVTACGESNPILMAIGGSRLVQGDKYVTDSGEFLQWPPVIRKEEVNALLVPRPSSAQKWNRAAQKMGATTTHVPIERKKQLAQRLMISTFKPEKYGKTLECIKALLL